MDLHPTSETLTSTQGDASALSTAGAEGLASSSDIELVSSASDRTPDHKSKTSPDADGSHGADGHALSPLAATLLQPLDRFFRALSESLDDNEVSIALAVVRQREALEDEEADFDAMVFDVVCGTTPAAAQTIAAALAARTFATSVIDAGALERPESEALLQAWIEIARAIVDARGSEGLMRLLPTARHLARRSIERQEPVAAIADAMRRVASRISADPVFGRPAQRAPAKRVRESARAETNKIRRRSAFDGHQDLTLRVR